MKTNEENIIDFSQSMNGFDLQKSTSFALYLESFNKPEINILYIGESFQEVYLLPFLKQIRSKNKDILIKVYTVNAKSSEEMFREDTFKQTVLGKDVDLPINKTNANSIENVEYIFVDPHSKHEFDLNSKSLSAKTIKLLFEGKAPFFFDMIFCCFELHFCINWRFSLIKLLGLLDRGGVFLFSEISGTVCLLDGNIPPTYPVESDTNEFISFLKKFEETRSRYHYWKPEISFTNYREVSFFLKHFFNSNLSSFVSKDNNPTLNISKEVFVNFFKERKLEYFSIGLDKSKSDELEDLLQSIEMNWNDFNKPLTKDITLYAAYNFKPELLSRPDFINWNYSTFSKDIQEINGFEIENLTRKAIDVLVSHDVIFPEGTFCLSMVSWIGDDYSWRYPMSIVKNEHLLGLEKKNLPPEVIEKKFQKLLALEYHYGKSILDFLFKGRKEKFTIIFQLHSNNSKNHLFDENNSCFRDDKDGNVWIGFYLKKNRKGQFQKLIIGCSQKLISDHIIKNIKFVRSYVINENKYYSSRKITKNLSKVTIRKEFKDFVSNEFSDKRKVFIKNQKRGNHTATSLLKKFNQSLASLDQSLGEKYISIDLLTLVFKSFLEPVEDNRSENISESGYTSSGSQLSIFPAGLPDTRNDKNIKGLGIFLYEKNPPVEDKVLFRQIMSRDKVLKRISSLIFQRTASIHYVNQDFTEKARQAAIAAISARNFSHNLGSHVVPKIFSKDENDLSVPHLLKFMEYTQQRNDFINQLTSVAGRWTMSIWFIKDLMAKFYQQYYLLDYLASYEGISAYSYDGHEQEDQVNYKEFELNESLLINKNVNHVILFGYLTISKDKIFLSNKNMVWDSSKIIKIKCEFDWAKIRSNPNKGIINELLEKFNGTEELLLEELLKQKGRPFKIYGDITYDENGIEYFSIHGFIENKLVIKVRRRSFAKVEYCSDGKYKDIKIETTSDVLNNRDIECYNLSKFGETGNTIFEKIQLRSLKNKKGQFNYFGVIKKIEGNSIFLCCELNEYTKKYSSQYQYKSTLQAIFPATKQLLKHKNITSLIAPGKRILFTGVLEELNGDESEIVVNTCQPFYIKNAKILEIVKIDYLVTSTSQTDANKNSILDKDLKIAIPGGISGYQSFYTILENIIRNSAKHDWVVRSLGEKLGRSLEVKIEIEDQKDPDHYICKIWTNTSDLNINQKGREKLNEQINTFLMKDIIEEGESGGAFRQKNIGISEIKINAAFLSSKSGLITDKSKLKGDGVILNEKIEEFDDVKPGGKVITGFLRASRFMEFENGEIHERLGYRFKLQKPKELLIISDQDEFNKITSEYEINLLALKENIIDENGSLIREQRGNLDYELCLILQSENFNESIRSDERCFSQLLSKFFQLILLEKDKNHTVIKENDEIRYIFSKIFDKLEKYPYRLIWIIGEHEIENTNIKLYKFLFEIRRKVPETCEVSLRDKILFLKRRLIFLKRKSFKQMLSIIQFRKTELITDVELLKLLLYDKWIRIFERKFHREKIFKLKVDLKSDESTESDEATGNSVYLPPTLPTNIRRIIDIGNDKGGNNKINIPKPLIYERYEQLKNFITDEGKKDLVSFIFEFTEDKQEPPKEKDKKENVLIISYKRHGGIFKSLNSKEGNEVIYSEELTGENLSFPQFSVLINSDQKHNYLYHKFFFQLFEIAYPNVLILDERIIEFQKSLSDTEIINFLNTNIIIPYDLKVIGIENYRIQGKKLEDSITTLVDNEKSVLGQMKMNFQYLNSYYWINENEKLDAPKLTPPINTVIIHQSILERILRNRFVNPSEENIQEIIQEIKFEIPSLIITSGKGKTDTYSKYAKYLPFSTLKGLLMSKSPDKILLLQVLFKTLK